MGAKWDLDIIARAASPPCLLPHFYRDPASFRQMTSSGDTSSLTVLLGSRPLATHFGYSADVEENAMVNSQMSLYVQEQGH